MNRMIYIPKRILKILFLCSALSAGAIEQCLLEAGAQTVWDNSENPKKQATTLVWEMTDGLGKSVAPQIIWDKVTDEERDEHQPSRSLVWEILEANDLRIIPAPEAEPKSRVRPPTTEEDFEALRNTIPFDATDTPQPTFSSRQRSLSLGGLTVNTALIPHDTISITRISSDTEGNINTSVGYSISNEFQFNLHKSSSSNIPQDNPAARSYLNDGATNWRGSGKAILASPLRGAPLWSALRLSLGSNIDTNNNTKSGYLFAETPFTWEANSKIAININPKLAWSEIGTMWGLGIGTNINLAPRWEILSEANIILNSHTESNITLGLRWHTSDNIAVEIYGSTASSILDIGQLLDAEEIRWGSRLILKL